MTKPEVFIIESVKFDEEETYLEGEMISRSLRMSLKNPIYRYVRTKKELTHFLQEFRQSDYRYLHISCHGNDHGISTTLDKIRSQELAEMVGPLLKGRRLFLSTCKATTRELADAVFSNGECYSLVGPVGKINFDDSVVFWTSFYHVMFKTDDRKMVLSHLKKNLTKSAKLVNEKMNLFVRAPSGKALLFKIPIA
jgi:hypothetical protein